MLNQLIKKNNILQNNIFVTKIPSLFSRDGSRRRDFVLRALFAFHIVFSRSTEYGIKHYNAYLFYFKFKTLAVRRLLYNMLQKMIGLKFAYYHFSYH